MNQKKAARPVRGLIFDFDGLIVDTESPVYESWKMLYAENGHELTLETWVKCVGSDFGHYDPVADLERLCGRKLDWREMERRRAAESKRLSKSSGLLPGVKSILDEAESAGIPRAVASSSPSEWVLPWLGRLEIDHHFMTVRTLDHVSNPKPDPELFIAAADALGIEPAELLVFEDSLNGLKAATAAGMRCVVIPNAVTGLLDFSGATLRLNSLADVSLSDLLDTLSRET